MNLKKPNSNTPTLIKADLKSATINAVKAGPDDIEFLTTLDFDATYLDRRYGQPSSVTINPKSAFPYPGGFRYFSEGFPVTVFPGANGLRSKVRVTGLDVSADDLAREFERLFSRPLVAIWDAVSVARIDAMVMLDIPYVDARLRTFFQRKRHDREFARSATATTAYIGKDKDFLRFYPIRADKRHGRQANQELTRYERQIRKPGEILGTRTLQDLLTKRDIEQVFATVQFIDVERLRTSNRLADYGVYRLILDEGSYQAARQLLKPHQRRRYDDLALGSPVRFDLDDFFQYGLNLWRRNFLQRSTPPVPRRRAVVEGV